MKNKALRSLVLAAMFLAAALLLPFITGQSQGLGTKLCLMHLPVLLCGILCGSRYGFAVGLIAAPLRFLIFGAPTIPMCLFMAVELAVYGALSGALRRAFPKKLPYLLLTLVLSMIGGRIAYGIVWWAVGTAGGNPFSISAFLTTSFAQALPGIALQLVLIPILIAALERSGIFKKR